MGAVYTIDPQQHKGLEINRISSGKFGGIANAGNTLVTVYTLHQYFIHTCNLKGWLRSRQGLVPLQFACNMHTSGITSEYLHHLMSKSHLTIIFYCIQQVAQRKLSNFLVMNNNYNYIYTWICSSSSTSSPTSSKSANSSSANDIFRPFHFAP